MESAAPVTVALVGRVVPDAGATVPGTRVAPEAGAGGTLGARVAEPAARVGALGAVCGLVAGLVAGGAGVSPVSDGNPGRARESPAVPAAAHVDSALAG
jgi:hypothetical protein